MIFKKNTNYHNIEDVWRYLVFNDKKENMMGIGNESNSKESSSLDDGQKIGDNLEFKSLKIVHTKWHTSMYYI